MNANQYKNEMMIEDIDTVISYTQVDELEDFRTQVIEGNSGTFELLDEADTPWLDALVADEDAALALTDEQLEDIALRTKGHVFCSIVRFRKYIMGWDVGTESSPDQEG